VKERRVQTKRGEQPEKSGKALPTTKKARGRGGHKCFKGEPIVGKKGSEKKGKVGIPP